MTRNYYPTATADDSNAETTWLPETCPDCGEAREYRTCADCGTTAWVIDCGHYAQPAEIAASAHAGGEDVCEDCEATRGE